MSNNNVPETALCFPTMAPSDSPMTAVTAKIQWIENWNAWPCDQVSRAAGKGKGKSGYGLVVVTFQFLFRENGVLDRDKQTPNEAEEAEEKNGCNRQHGASIAAWSHDHSDQGKPSDPGHEGTDQAFRVAKPDDRTEDRTTNSPGQWPLGNRSNEGKQQAPDGGSANNDRNAGGWAEGRHFDNHALGPGLSLPL
jgi:hypothetical protein